MTAEVGTRSLVMTSDLTPIYTSLLAEWADLAARDTAASPTPDDEPGGAPG